MEKETAEMSSHVNWLHKQLRTAGFDIYDIEGYSLDEDTDSVELLVDRRRVDDIRGYNIGRVARELDENFDDTELEAKRALAAEADCDYAVAIYDDTRVRVFRFPDTGIEATTDELSFPEFGAWVFGHNSTEAIEKDFIHDDEFPNLDSALRANGTPWPPNLDGFWYSDDGVEALIEYQTTKVSSPANHSNNQYFSEDHGRWKHLWGLADAMDLPLLIIVWSPVGKYQDEVKVKKVHDVTFVGRDRGLAYESVQLMEPDDVPAHVKQVSQ